MRLFGGKKNNEANVRNPHITDQNDEYSFRRSRTLTGSASSNVTAANESRSQIKSTRLKEHELRSHRKKLAAYLAISAVGLMGLWWLLSQFVWSISSVDTTTPLKKPIDNGAYVKIIEDYFHTRPLERFRFVLREGELTKYIQSQRPEVASAMISADDLFMTGQLVVEIRRPLLVWKINETTYYVDNDGMAFNDNHFVEPKLVIKDNSGIDPDAGAIASHRVLRFIGRTVTLVNEAPGVPDVSEVVLPPNLTRQIDLKLAGKGYTIKTQLDRDPAGQAMDIINAVRYFEKRSIVPKYIDVRVSSSAYYR